MERLSHMVSMARDPEEIEKAKESYGAISPSVPIYPYGLAISLTQDEIDKLDVDHSDWEVGDLFHLHALAKITSISKSENSDGACCRVEMQIVALAGENEDDENDDYNDEMEQRGSY